VATPFHLDGLSVEWLANMLRAGEAASQLYEALARTGQDSEDGGQARRSTIRQPTERRERSSAKRRHTMEQSTPFATLQLIARGYALSRCLHVIADLGVADMLDATPYWH